MEHKFEIRQMFDDDFKRKVIEEYLLTGCTKIELQRKYNIRFKSAISTWMQRMGYFFSAGSSAEGGDPAA